MEDHLSQTELTLYKRVRLSGPSWWGPSTWAFFHITAASAPEFLNPEQQSLYRALYERFGDYIACKSICSKHYAEIFKSRPIVACCRFHLFAWTIAVHNDVNKRLGKPEVSLEQGVEMFNSTQSVRRSGGLGGDVVSLDALRGQPESLNLSAGLGGRDDTGLMAGQPWGWIFATTLIVLAMGILLYVAVRASQPTTTKNLIGREAAGAASKRK